MPGPNLLPGKRGTDYRLVRYGDRVYAVYRVKLGDGRWVNTTWRVDPGDYKALGIKPEGITKIGKSAYRSLNIFGSVSEIARTGAEQHPFQAYVKDLKERYGNVSWIDDKQFMSVMLMGWAENWTAAELEQRLKRTHWYQSRTDAQRQWELETGKADRQTTLASTRERIQDALKEIYGPAYDWTQDYDPEALDKAALRIASGKLGDPSEGFEIWISNAQDRAAKIEGTNAWIELQQQLEQQRAFMNRPEDVQEQLRQEAFEWLGPRGVPDDAVLKSWAGSLVAETRSDADWQKYLRNQATSLYPYLGPEERWQDRAGTYKRIIEENWGTTVGWDNPLLFHIGEQNPTSGEYTGAARSYDDFERMVRSRDEFWQGSVARDEGAQLFAQLNDTFRGVR